MTQHSTAGRGADIPRPDGATARQGSAGSTNDNGDGQTLITPAVEAALRHFGAFGLGAAQAALERAAEAAADGNEEDSAHWLGIARMFDRPAVERFASHRRTRSGATPPRGR